MASRRLIRRASSYQGRNDNGDETDPLLEVPRIARHTSQDTTTDPYEDHHFYPNPFADLPIYNSIWRVRRDLLDAVNDPYSYDQLRAPRLNNAVVRPLVERYYAMQDISLVFCLLVNRIHFLKDISNRSHFASVRTTRALLCEIVALRLLRQYDEDSSGSDGLLLLTNIVIAGFDPFQGAPKDCLKSSARSLAWALQDRGGYESQLTALEVAILSESKLFLSSAACQKVVEAIYMGRIVYTPTSFIDILPDHYKHKAISIYNPRKAPLLNTYRLSVPRIRNIVEIFQFIILLTLYLVLMTTKDPKKLRLEEIIFVVFTLGWILDQLASMLEHGWAVYSQNLWSFLDTSFSVIFFVYLCLRVNGVATGRIDISRPALDWLAMGAPFLVPRLAFNLFSENLLFVSLRDMMAKFMLLTFLAVWSFAGFFLAMVWLDWNDSTDPVSGLTTGLWMVWVWFGLDGTGIERSTDFHSVLGPVLMISFAILGNTLFLTILVATLSESFAKIARHASGEIQFRRAVLTFQAVKSDAIFAYPPPFNVLALVTVLPLKLVLSARWFHKLNSTSIKVLNAPFLLMISLWERHYLWPSQHNLNPRSVARILQSLSKLNWFHVHGDIEAVFDSPPPDFIDKPSDDIEARRRKSVQTCAPDGDDSAMSPGTKSPSRPRNMPGTPQRSMSRGMRGTDKDTTETRLERIEELLENIGNNIEDGEEEDS